ncbi:MAG: recombinase family protein [Bilifractor sp.]
MPKSVYCSSDFAENPQKSASTGEKAVVYCRYSSHGQTEQSIEGQQAAAKKYADAHGYAIIHEYIDRAKTGTNDNREEFQRMLSDCAKHQFTVIIVWKVDRFGRNREEITFNKYRAKKHGVRVEYVAENISRGPEGVILESVLEGMAEYFSLQLSQNVRRGLMETAKKHHIIGRAPYGYKSGPHNEYVIDERVAPVIRLIFRKYADGYTQSEIISLLNSQGHRTSTGQEFTKNSIPKILKNERYIGTYVYRDLIHDEDSIPAIIDKETFYKCQEMLSINRRMPSHKWSYTDYILTGKIFCGLCGSDMLGVSGIGKMGVKYNYYYCSNHRKKAGCTKKPVRQDWLENLIINETCKILNDPKAFDYIVEQTYAYYLKTEKQYDETEGLQKEAQSVQSAISNLTRAVEQGLPFETVKSRLEELNGQLTAINKALSEKALEKSFRLTREQIEYFLGQIRDMDLTERKCQRRMVETFVNSVFVFDDQIKIAFNYKGGAEILKLSDIEKAGQHTLPGKIEFDCEAESRGTGTKSR